MSMSRIALRSRTGLLWFHSNSTAVSTASYLLEDKTSAIALVRDLHFLIVAFVSHSP